MGRPIYLRSSRRKQFARTLGKDQVNRQLPRRFHFCCAMARYQLAPVDVGLAHYSFRVARDHCYTAVPTGKVERPTEFIPRALWGWRGREHPHDDDCQLGWFRNRNRWVERVDSRNRRQRLGTCILCLRLWMSFCWRAGPIRVERRGKKTGHSNEMLGWVAFLESAWVW